MTTEEVSKLTVAEHNHYLADRARFVQFSYVVNNSANNNA